MVQMPTIYSKDAAACQLATDDRHRGIKKWYRQQTDWDQNGKRIAGLRSTSHRENT